MARESSSFSFELIWPDQQTKAFVKFKFSNTSGWFWSKHDVKDEVDRGEWLFSQVNKFFFAKKALSLIVQR